MLVDYHLERYELKVISHLNHHVDKKSKSQSQKSKPSKPGEPCEELFVSEYEQVQRVRILSAAHLSKYVNQIRASLTGQEQHWHDRVAAIQMIRSLLLSGAASHNNFLQLLRTLNVAFSMCLNDVSRQVVRETCITMAFLAKLLCNDFEHCAEVILPILINAIPIVGKGACAIITLKLIVQHTHSSRLIPPLIKGLSSGNCAIRRECAKVLYELVRIWPTSSLEKRYHMILENIKLRINDTSGETRLNAARIISTLLDRFKDKEKTKPGRRSMSEPRSSYPDIMPMRSSNFSDTSFAVAVSKIKDETLESLRDDHVQKGHSEPTRRFDGIDDVGRGSDGESAALAGQYDVDEVYSSTMEQLANAMTVSTSSRSSTYYRGTSVPRSSPQMAAPPNFEWVLLPSFPDQQFSEEATGGAALENPPVPYEKSAVKKSHDARKCSSHNESATTRSHRGDSPQSKSVQQIKQGTPSTVNKHSPRKLLANTAATNFHASRAGRLTPRKGSVDKQPSTKNDKVEQTGAAETSPMRGDTERVSDTWACSSIPDTNSSTSEVCQIQSANLMTLTTTTGNDSPVQITRSASINALSTSDHCPSPSGDSVTAAAASSCSSANTSELMSQLSMKDVQETEHGERERMGDNAPVYGGINENDNITNTTAYVDEKEKAEYDDGEEVEQADVTNDEDQDESVTLEDEGDTELKQPQGQANNEEDICLSYVPTSPLCMTDELNSDDVANTSDDASLSNCSVATVKRNKNAVPSTDIPAATQESAVDRQPRRSAFKPVLRHTPEDDSSDKEPTSSKQPTSAKQDGSKSTCPHIVCEGLPQKVLKNLGSHVEPEKQTEGLHGMKKLLYFRHHLSRKIPSGNVFHRLLAIRKSDSKSPSPLASESSKGAAGKSSVPDLPKGARADRRKR
ncbi:hypothetical protein LSAT2_025358 [Lamellibrachia satsuma]|nr:hypothetical protein LSAT2_025358 [Lamellibrachia satsuma]